LGAQFDTQLFRKMQHFGMPLVPSALALWTINFVDREFVSWYKDNAEVGVYSAAVKIAGVITFVMVAFRTAWPAFAYSIEDDREAKRTYSFVLTYLLTLASWLSLALGAAVSTAVSYVVLFVGMTIYAQRVYPVPYQWRRVMTSVGAAVGLTVAARAAHLPLAPSLLLVLAYPLALALLGFYLPAERAR